MNEDKQILHLNLVKRWFDKIASGEKCEEYRDISKHWIKRLCNTGNILDGFKEFEIVEFRNGYQPNAPTMQIEIQGIDVGTGKSEWGANGESFIIKLGKIISIKNYKETPSLNVSGKK